MARYRIDGVLYNIDEDALGDTSIVQALEEVRSSSAHQDALKSKQSSNMPFMYDDKRTESEAMADVDKKSFLGRVGSGIVGAAEVPMSMGTGFLAGNLAKGARAGMEMLGGQSMEDALKAGDESAKDFTYQPRSDMGRVMGDVVGHGLEAAKTFMGDVGERAMDPEWRNSQVNQPNSALGRTLGEFAFDAIPIPFLGRGVARSVKGRMDLKREARDEATRQQVAQVQAEQAIETGRMRAEQQRNRARILADEETQHKAILESEAVGLNEFEPKQPFEQTPRTYAATSAVEDFGKPEGSADGRSLLGKPADMSRWSLEERLQFERDRIEQQTGTIGTDPFNNPNSVNFPLRQEVLNQPGVRLTIDNFRRNVAELEAAKKWEEAAAMREKFGKYMERFGIKTPEDAHGLERRFWEGESKALPVEKTERPSMEDQRGTGGTPFNMFEGEIKLGMGIDAVEWARKYGMPALRKLATSFGQTIPKAGDILTTSGIGGSFKKGLKFKVENFEVGKHTGNFMLIGRFFEPAMRISEKDRKAVERAHEIITTNQTRLDVLWDEKAAAAHEGRGDEVKLLNERIDHVHDIIRANEDLIKEFHRDEGSWGPVTTVSGERLKEFSEFGRDLDGITDSLGEQNAKSYQSGPGGKQGGAIDFNIFKETYADFKKGVEKTMGGPVADSIVKAMWDQKQAGTPAPSVQLPKGPISNIPGLKQGLDDLRVNTTPLAGEKVGNTYVTNQALKAELTDKDISGSRLLRATRQLTSGAQATARLYGSKFLKYGADLVNEAVTNIESTVSKLSISAKHGFTHAIDELSAKEQADLWTRFIRPNVGKRDLSLQDMKDAGATPKQIEALMRWRSAASFILDEVNKVLLSKGMKPVERLPGYFPAKFIGDFYIPVYGDKAMNQIIGLYSANNKKNIQRVAEQIQRDHPDYTIPKDDQGNFVISERNPWARKRENASVWSVFSDVQRILENGDPRAKVLADLLSKYENDSMRYQSGHFQHRKQRKGIEGSTGRDAYKTDHENAKMAFKAAHEYIQQSIEFIEFNKIGPSMNKLLSKDEFPGMPNSQAYMSQYWDRARGIPSAIAQAQYSAVSAIAHEFGFSGGAVKAGLGFVKPQVLLMMLGYNTPRFLIAQMLQPNQFLTQNIMSLRARGLDIGVTDVVNSWGKGIYHAYQLSKDRSHLEPHARKALEWAEDNQIVEPHMFEDIKTDIEKARDNAFSYINGEKSIRWTEKKARLQTFMTFADLLNREGLSFKEQMEMSANLTRHTMVDYRPFEKPLLYQNMGIVGDMVSPLKTFAHNYYTQMAIGINELLRAPWKDKPQYAVPVVLALAMQQLFSGLMGLPGREDADMIMGWAKHFWPKFPDATQLILQSEMLKGKDGKPRNLITHGVSTITGLDMSPTFSAASLMPEKRGEAFPIVSKAWDMITSIPVAAFEQTKASAWNVAKQFTPNAFQGGLELAMQDPSGTVPNPKMNMHGDVRRSTDPTSKEWVARYLGSRTIDESREKASVFEQKKEESAIRDRKTLLLQRGYDAWSAGKSIEKYAVEAGQYGMTPKEFNNAMIEIHKQRITTEQQRSQGLRHNTPQQQRKFNDMQRYN